MSEKEFAQLIEANPSLIKTAPVPQKSNKYKNVKIYEYEDSFVSEDKNLKTHGKITKVFDSIKEFQRWNELKLAEKAGVIFGLDRQRTLLIQEAFTYKDTSGNSVHINKIEYKADFFYIKDNTVFVEDVKAFDVKTNRYILTKDFKLKWKLLMYKYPDYQFIIY